MFNFYNLYIFKVLHLVLPILFNPNSIALRHLLIDNVSGFRPYKIQHCSTKYLKIKFEMQFLCKEPSH